MKWAIMRLGVGLGRVPARLALRGGGELEITTTCDQTTMGECVAIVGPSFGNVSERIASSFRSVKKLHAIPCGHPSQLPR